MWIATVTTSLGKNAVDQVTAALDALLGTWRMNGQICGSEWPIWATRSTLHATVMIPAFDALEPRFDRRWSKQRRAALEAMHAPVSTRTEGEAPDSATPCACAERSALILYTDFLCLESPLRCADCFDPVPLFTVEPGHFHEDHHPVISWQSDYQACDRLQMNTAVGERFAERQLVDLDSALSRQGREVVALLCQTTGVPVYYYLHKSRARSLAAEHARRCPACGGPWLLDAPLFDRFDFRCTRCALLSNIAASVARL